MKRVQELQVIITSWKSEYIEESRIDEKDNIRTAEVPRARTKRKVAEQYLYFENTDHGGYQWERNGRP